MKVSFLCVLLIWRIHMNCIKAQQKDSSDDNFLCDCMEYWDCIGEGGTPYSYCEYSNKVCCFVDGSAKETGILPKKKKLSACGQKGADDHVDGTSAPGEWPWHVAILEKPLDLYVCGGSLVDEYWILTAAHCVDKYNSVNFLKIRLGEHDVTSRSELYGHEEFDASRVVIHPRFDNDTLKNDLALVRLVRAAKRRPNINVVCMPESETTDQELIASGNCFITGWGRKAENCSHSVVLKEVNVPIWKQESCEASLQLHFGSDFQLPNSSLCAGAQGRDACDGDGGGPLVCQRRSRWYQVGVVSFGIGCGRRNVPGVYTRVYSFITWIKDTVVQNR